MALQADIDESSKTDKVDRMSNTNEEWVTPRELSKSEFVSGVDSDTEYELDFEPYDQKEEFIKGLRESTTVLENNLNTLLDLIDAKEEDKTRYSDIVSVINKLSPLIKQLIDLAYEENVLGMFSDTINLLLSTIDIIATNIIVTTQNVVNKRNDAINDDEQLLRLMIESIRSTGIIDKSLITNIEETRNASLDRYVSSILGTKEKSNEKFNAPWISEITKPSPEEIDEFINDTTNQPKDEVFYHNFSLLLKQTYFITKLNVRNLNMIRLADIKTTNENIIKYQNILHSLLFIKVNKFFLPIPYESLFRNNIELNHVFARLLGDEKYSFFINNVIDDGKHFNETNTVKTETMLKYLVFATENIHPNQTSQYGDFYDNVIRLISSIIKNNRNITQLDSIVTSTNAEGIIQDVLRQEHKSHIYTFVKIRVDDNPNQRFRVTTDNDRQILFMGYTPTIDSLYDDNKNLKQTYRSLTDFSNPYPDNYLFGPFSYIFKPGDSNSYISNHQKMQPLLEKLRKGNPVCIVGYGTSGSGKTSTLIHFDAKKIGRESEDGILMHFCGLLSDVYKKIELSFVELEGNINQTDKFLVTKEYKIIPIPYNEKNNPKYTKEDHDKEEYYKTHSFSYTDGNWYGDSKKTLGDHIVHIMNTKRSIHKTPNNPVSSRSHMMIFVKFINEKTQTTLSICDFAGVENEFNCSNKETREKIIKLYIDYIKQTETLQNTNIEDVGEPPFLPSNMKRETIDTLIDLDSDKINNMFEKSPTQIKLEIQARNVTRIVSGKNVKSNQRLLTSLQMAEEYIRLFTRLKSVFTNTNKEEIFTINIDYNKFIEKMVSTSIYFTKNTVLLLISKIFPRGSHSDFTKLKKDINDHRTLENIFPPDTIKTKEDIDIFFNQIISYYEWKKSSIQYSINQQKLKETRNDREKDVHTRRVKLLTKICKDRVKEGFFINDSLYHLRRFVSYFITKIQNKNSVINPRFIDACVPIQCNPNYEDCFGFSEKIQNENSVIADVLRSNVSNFDSLTFCIFNIINLSKNVDPPPSPYIDISVLINERNRLESLDEMFHMEYKINNDNKSTLVQKSLLEDLQKNPILLGLETSIREEILNRLKPLIDQHENHPPPKSDGTLIKLKSLLSYVETINSLSIIGTMEFTDMISKYGLNRNVCNYKYPKIDNENTLDMMNDYKKWIVSLNALYNKTITL